MGMAERLSSHCLRASSAAGTASLHHILTLQSQRCCQQTDCLGRNPLSASGKAKPFFRRCLDINLGQINMQCVCNVLPHRINKGTHLKMRPFIDTMRKNIADTLHIDLSQVNVKATTEEGLGFTGSGEGISSQAICLLTTPLGLQSEDVMQRGCAGCTGCPKTV